MMAEVVVPGGSAANNNAQSMSVDEVHLALVRNRR